MIRDRAAGVWAQAVQAALRVVLGLIALLALRDAIQVIATRMAGRATMIWPAALAFAT